MARSQSRKRSICPAGSIHRKGYYRRSYTRKDGARVKGTRVAGGCIKATSALGIKRSVLNKLIMQSRSRSQKRAAKLTRRKTPKRCPKGSIKRVAYMRSGYRRKGYTRKDGTYVKPAYVKKVAVSSGCIKDVGKPGKGRKLIGPLMKGALGRFGYHHSLSAQTRHASLKEAVKSYGALSVFRKLNAVYVLNKNKSPGMAKVFLSDRNWVKKKYKVGSRSRRRSVRRSPKRNSRARR